MHTIRADWDKRRMLTRVATSGDNNERGISVWQDKQGKYHEYQWGRHGYGEWTHNVAREDWQRHIRNPLES